LPEVLKSAMNRRTTKSANQPSPKYLQLRGGKLGTLFSAARWP
jgi:hypothetical protein